MTFDLGNPIITLFVVIGILIAFRFTIKVSYDRKLEKKNRAIEDHRLNLKEKTLPKGFSTKGDKGN